MGDDQEQEQGQAQSAALPLADGPLVDVTLPDGQRLYAVVKARVREPDGWWYDLQIHVPHQSSERGRLLALPAAVDFRAPAALCEPIDGQPYDQVPTERPGTTPAWKVEEKVYCRTKRDDDNDRRPDSEDRDQSSQTGTLARRGLFVGRTSRRSVR
ncbi:hypothetical protein [Actinacidiphila paucisporea]|uniref:Uncharacterized protein n=1 Tax=Actinacidiphila paucisporea TaxID=310782 RepID=A0A1M7QMU1_9ACTN|nr:hypothetical protein [Actinacidiphila paucisporea]SHN32532.1 hypothetical protein SAMN05216499_1382 [Actinacidiphila paucisporea]